MPIPVTAPVESPATEQPVDPNAKKPEIVYPPVAFDACLNAWATPTTIEGYNCPRCKRATAAQSSTSFKSYPKYLLVVMRRFLFDSWVPTKLDAPVEVISEVNLERFRSRGQQPNEELLPSDAPSAASAPVPNPEIVSMLEGMGFSTNACSRAALAVNNSDGEAAMNWLLSHMEDADINDPLPSATSSSSGPIVPAELIAQLASMGFPADRCEYALKQTNNSADRAVEWLFSHMDDPLPSESAPVAAAAVEVVDNAPPHYQLHSAITHLGKSTSVGHYVCHLRSDDGSWVLFNDEKVSAVPTNERGVGQGMDRAYLYVYQRV